MNLSPPAPSELVSPKLVSPKRALFTELAAVAQALAHEHRLELLELLAQGEQSVDVLAQRTGLSIANASQHLQQLRRINVATARRDGRFVFYRLADDRIVHLIELLRQVSEQQVADVPRLIAAHLAPLDDLTPMSAADLMAALASGTVRVLDVRPEDEYRQGHVPGAVNVPPGRLEAHLVELSHDTPIVAYCRGPYCVFSFEAVARLRELGYNVRRLEAGLPQWRAAGLPVERVSAVLV